MLKPITCGMVSRCGPNADPHIRTSRRARYVAREMSKSVRGSNAMGRGHRGFCWLHICWLALLIGLAAWFHPAEPIDDGRQKERNAWQQAECTQACNDNLGFSRTLDPNVHQNLCDDAP